MIEKHRSGQRRTEAEQKSEGEQKPQRLERGSRPADQAVAGRARHLQQQARAQHAERGSHQAVPEQLPKRGARRAAVRIGHVVWAVGRLKGLQYRLPG